MRGQLVQTTDGQLLCNFPERMVLMANHQIYTDWLYLWWIGYTAGMHGRIYVVLKESLKSIPVIGWGMQFAQFIFLKRKWEQDKPRLAQHMQRFKNKEPMWLMMFPEGTNLADCTRDTSRKWAATNGIKDMQHTLLPRSTGLHFMLQELKDNVEFVYDCTIAYEGVPRGQYAQDIFTVGASYFGGRPPKSVNMYWRRFRVANIPLDDPQKFDIWLRARWSEKDRFIENWYRTGRFPADTGSNKDYSGKITTGAGYIEAEVKPQRWYEFLQVFAPIGLFALVIYVFYGALPKEMINSIRSIDQKAVVKHLDAIQKGQLKVPETKDIIATAPKHLQNRIDAVRKIAEAKNTTPEKIIAQLQDSDNGSVYEKGTKATESQKPVNKSKPSRLPGNPNPVKLPGNPNPNVASASKPTKTPTSKTKTRTNNSKASTKPANTVAKASTTATPTQGGTSTTKAKPNTGNVKQQNTPRQPTAVPKKSTASGTPLLRSSNVSARPTALTHKTQPHQNEKSDKPLGSDEHHVNSAELRKTRKRLEARQSKQLPPRKIKRALATHK